MSIEIDAVLTVHPLSIKPDKPTPPVHAVRDSLTLTWCGIRPQFRHVERPGTLDEVTCAKCLRAIKRGRGYARGGR